MEPLGAGTLGVTRGASGGSSPARRFSPFCLLWPKYAPWHDLCSHALNRPSQPGSLFVPSQTHLPSTVYHGATTWTFPVWMGWHTRNSLMRSSDILRVSSWSEQTLPPLALAYKHRKVEAGETKSELKRLRLIWLRPLNFQEQGPSFHLWSGLSRPIITSGIEWRCHPNTQTSCCYGHMRWMANNMPCFGWVLRIRKQLRFRLYCAERQPGQYPHSQRMW